MTWRGREEALPCNTIDELRAYIRSLDYSSWRPSGQVLHNTASPTLDQWWHGGTSPEQRMKNLRNYYENDCGWSAGPHAFIDGETWWIFTDFNVKGVHSPSWNGTRLGFEMVGDYDSESDETGMGLKVMEMTVQLFGEISSFFGWEPNNDTIKLHKEDPSTDHDCPGSNVVKAEFVDDVNEYMGEGGDDHHDIPERRRRGVVIGLATGDPLNVRAAASSSSPVIGQAENGDKLTIVDDAYNGSTQWLRVQFGHGAGEGVAIFGWVSAQYVDIEGGPEPEEDWNEGITATVFGAGDDEQETAYGGWVDDSSEGVALPYKWKSDKPRVVVEGPDGDCEVDIIDLGPWNTHDPSYVL